MNVLSLDTTSEFGSVAVRANGQTLAETELPGPQGFAHLIFPAIEQVLKLSGLEFDALDCFAAASGPGSFTGVRVGLAAVKGFATASAKPAVGISNLQALASFGEAPLRAVLLDARRDEVYASVYDSGGRMVSPEVVTRLAGWLDRLTEPDYDFISPLDPALLEGTRFRSMPFLAPPRALASAIALCAEQALLANPLTSASANPTALDANYVRRSDAELFWRDA